MKPTTLGLGLIALGVVGVAVWYFMHRPAKDASAAVGGSKAPHPDGVVSPSATWSGGALWAEV